MLVKLSETPMFYQPVGTVEQLKADLEMFSDPTQYDQDDWRLQMVLEELLNLLNGTQLNVKLHRSDDST